MLRALVLLFSFGCCFPLQADTPPLLAPPPTRATECLAARDGRMIPAVRLTRIRRPTPGGCAAVLPRR